MNLSCVSNHKISFVISTEEPLWLLSQLIMIFCYTVEEWVMLPNGLLAEYSIMYVKTAVNVLLNIVLCSTWGGWLVFGNFYLTEG